MDNKISTQRKKTNLDRGFPVGSIIVLMLVAVVFFQTLSAWKIMNLEKEKATLEVEKQNFIFLNNKIPEMRTIAGDLSVKLQELKVEVDVYEKRRALISKEVSLDEQKSIQLKSECVAMEKNINDSDKNLADKKATVEELSAKKSQLLRDVDFNKSVAKQLAEENTLLGEVIKKCQADRNDLEEQNTRMMVQNDELKKLKDKNSELNKMNEDLGKIAVESNRRYQDMLNDFDKAKTAFKESVRSIESETETFKGIALRSGELEGKMNNTAALMQTEADRYRQKEKELNETNERIKKLLEDIRANLSDVASTDARIKTSMEKLDNLVSETTAKINSQQEINLNGQVKTGETSAPGEALKNDLIVNDNR